MITRHSSICSVGLLLALTIACLDPSTQALEKGQGQDSNKVPAGLGAADWSGIRAAYEAERHEIQPIENGWRARNPGQNWLTTFDKRGFVTAPQDGGGWTWGLELQSYGALGGECAIPGVPVVRTAGQRLTYDWSAGVAEWFVNDQHGLEHGFTVKERPAGVQGTLLFNLRVRGGLQPRVQADGLGVCFVTQEGVSAVTYAGLKVWDADGKILPAHFAQVTSGAALTLSVDERGARYPLTIDPTAQQAYLKASNPGSDDRFGASVAVFGDTVVVGAPREDSNATGIGGDQTNNAAANSGAVYVFVRSGTTWTQQAYLKASNARADNWFGYSVSISGDTIVVGAPNEDIATTGVNGLQTNYSGNADYGAAYVFVRSGSTWSQQAYLKSSTIHWSDAFGWSVAVSGDTIAVGSYGDSSNATGVNGNENDVSATYAGSVRVFVRNGTAWSQQAYLKASNTRATTYFGSVVALSGDTLVAGSFLEASAATGINGNQSDTSAAQSGAAYIFARSGTSWSQQAYVKASNTQGVADNAGAAWFGSSVAISGDTVVVGAPRERSNATGVNGNQADQSTLLAGAAYVYARTGTTWAQQAYLKPNATTSYMTFGASVGVSGNTVVVGAASANAAYVFSRTGTTWAQKDHVVPAYADTSDQFGLALGLSGQTLVVAAYQEDSNAVGVNGDGSDNSLADSGAAYPFLLPASPEISIAGNGAYITSGDATPSVLDHTDFEGTPVNGGTVARTFTVSNFGTQALNFTGTPKVAIFGANAADFTVTALPASVPAPTGNKLFESTTFQIIFNPSALGARNATVSIANNDLEQGTFTFAIRGTGTQPEITVKNAALSALTDAVSTLAFGSVEAGESVSQIVHILNDGDGVLTGLTIAIDGADAGDFDITSPPVSPVAPGDGTSFTITFHPLLPGAKTAALHLASNDTDEASFDLALTGAALVHPEIAVEDSTGAVFPDNATQAYGSASTGVVKTRYFVIRNTGTASLTGIAATLGGADAADFAIVTALPASSLAPGSSMILPVAFKPTAIKSSSATLSITSNDPDHPTHHTALTGAGVAPTAPEIGVKRDAPELDLVDNGIPVSFDNVTQGTASSLTFTIRNDGSQSLTGLALGKTTGAHAKDFLVDVLETNILYGGETTTFTITFLPTALGVRTATINLTSNDADEGSFQINVTGTGTAPEIGVDQPLGTHLTDGGSVSFGTTVAVGASVVKTFTILNTGTETLHLTGGIVDGANAADFVLGSPSGTNVVPSGSVTVDVTFTPSSFGVRTAALHILNDDANESPFDIKLTGTAIGPEISVQQPAKTELVDNVSAINFGSILQSATASRTFTIKNLGNAPLTGIAVNCVGSAKFTVAPSPAVPTTLAANATATFTIIFTPGSVSDYMGLVTVASNDFDESLFRVSLNGRGVETLVPNFTANPASQIIALGHPVTFSAVIDSQVAYTTQWLKGTGVAFANIAGATAASYTIPAVKLTDAAVQYRLRATSTSSADSDPAALTVVDRVSKSFNLAAAAKATFVVSAKSTGALTYRWLKDGADLPVDGRLVTGPPNQLVINNLNGDDAATYTCEVTGPGGTLAGGDNVLTVFSGVPVISPNPVVMDDGIVSGDYSFFIPLDSTKGTATTFTAAPLPAGLKLNATTGEIYGKPTASKDTPYEFTVTAKNAAGPASSAVAKLLVKPLTPGIDGTYVGIVERGPVNDDLGGRLDLTITNTGSYTGKITFGSKSYSFPAGSINAVSGSTDVTGNVVIARAPLAALTIQFTIDTLSSRFSAGTVSSDSDGSGIRGWKNTWSAAAQSSAYQGYYTFALDVPASDPVDNSIPQGIGFASFKAPLKGESFAIAGSLADGDTFTSSAFLGPDGDLLIYDDLPSKGSLSGITAIGLGTGPLYVDNVIRAGRISWSRPASLLPAATTYKAGFAPINLICEGGRYIAPAATAIVMGKLPGAAGIPNAAIAFFDAGLGGSPSPADRSFTLIPGSSLTIAAQGPALTTLKITTATGLFSGGFTLVESHPFLAAAPPITRKVTFQGIIIPTVTGQVGQGFFLLQQLPLNVFPVPTVLPVLSGGVVIE